ncbi:HD domain-containing protein [Anaerofustis stercorihominis]|uniref:HD domain-containing protein n=1 Tax=Anaerofustis stercorihominis TaxID=214853 RepID=UPI0011063CE3|nr:HD domain-containing protein [Anaerofustis stercorihominis]
MESNITFDEAFEILKKYNKDIFHIRHAITVSSVMGWYCDKLGIEDEKNYWEIVGLLHDVDFELYPNEHCKKAVSILKEENVNDDIIHSVCSHGYGICCDIEPTDKMEKVLFAIDELTGIINAAALMRPSKSTKDMPLKSLKKKFKSRGFAAGCDRDVIQKGAEMMGVELNELLSDTLEAMKANEDRINEFMENFEKNL